MAAAETQSNEHVKAFFLDLAAKGKDAWNAWRRDPANNDVPVTFAGIDFSKAPRDQIDFVGFEFGDNSDFSRCRWQNRVFFDEANFGHGVSFNDATFCNDAYFRATNFGHFADFCNAIFDGIVSFDSATFGNGKLFGSGGFEGDSAIFRDAIFSSLANFYGATFNPSAIFDGAIFRATVDFRGLPDDQFADKLERCLGPTDDKTARKELEERHRNSWKQHECRPDRFLNISFANARFGVQANLKGAALFSGRSFEDIADFTGAQFYFPPDFDSASHLDRIDFTGAHIGFVAPDKLFHWTEDSYILVRLRAFRKVAEETKNHDLERDLYIEERKAERGVYLRQLFEDLKKDPWKNWPRNAARVVAHLLWISVMGIYWALANYGRSFVRPFAWLIASGFFFYWRYTEVLAQLMAKAPDNEKYKQAVRMLALGNTVPFVGPLTIDSKVKEFLFCPCGKCPDPLIPPEGYQWLVLGQNLFSITCVFFIGLALRNYFKIK
jgi:Pentapeptide repeats (9 copies)